MIPWYHGEGKWQRFIFSKLRDGLGSLVSLFWGWRWFIRGKPGAVLAAWRQLFRSFSAACPQLFHSFSAAYNPNIIDWHGIGKNKTPVSWQYHVSLLSSSSSGILNILKNRYMGYIRQYSYIDYMLHILLHILYAPYTPIFFGHVFFMSFRNIQYSNL